MSFKIGEKVKVKTDLKVGNGYNSTPWDSIRESFIVKRKGDLVTIKGVCNPLFSDKKALYCIDESSRWLWPEEMFEPIHIVKVKRKVRTKT